MGSAGRDAEVTRADFPDGFVFGVATSAYQIEGARREGGKGDSIWDVFADNKEHILDGTTGEVAVDHYHRYKEDIELMAKLGFGAYRFSISWSRIFPDGLGKNINEQGVAFYNDLINFMIEKGIEPYATLYHWDLPHNLQQTMGGWLSDKIVKYFALYAEACFANFGDRVKHWMTINEPLQTSVNGYGMGIFAPGVIEGAAAEPLLAAHHQILAHAASVDVYRRKFKDVQGGVVGFVIDCEWAEPFSDKMEDQAAAARRIDFQLGWYLDPIYFGDYPESMRQRLGDHLPKFSEKDREFIRNKIDFIGLNHYTSRFIVHQQDPKDIHFYQVQQMERIEKGNTGEGIGERAASEWLFIVPWGLRKVLDYIVRKYENPIIYITENGMDDEDDESAPLDLVLNDTKRVGYFKGYLGAVAQAMKDGADVRGYFAWSFLDNFEWAQGYTKRFGLVYVDPASNFRARCSSSPSSLPPLARSPVPLDGLAAASSARDARCCCVGHRRGGRGMDWRPKAAAASRCALTLASPRTCSLLLPVSPSVYLSDLGKERSAPVRISRRPVSFGYGRPGPAVTGGSTSPRLQDLVAAQHGGALHRIASKLLSPCAVATAAAHPPCASSSTSLKDFCVSSSLKTRFMRQGKQAWLMS